MFKNEKRKEPSEELVNEVLEILVNGKEVYAENIDVSKKLEYTINQTVQLLDAGENTIVGKIVYGDTTLTKQFSVKVNTSITEFTLEELSAGTLEAHKRHRRVMAHAMSDESVRFCLEAGVDTIEHGVLIEEETISLMKKKHVGFIPTLSGIQKVYEHEKAAGNSTFAEKLYEEVISPHQTAVRKAIEHGVLIGTGSDTLGSVYEEITALVHCGMSPQTAFAAATINSASILGLQREIGTIEEGKFADFVILASNPMFKLEAYQEIREVIFGGYLLRDVYRG
jgi:imidazolonepropionase-like amidohydrolase